MSAREAVVDYLRTMLIGPGFGEADPVDGYEREVISNRLSLAYMMGLLYPRQASEEGDLSSDELGEGVDEDEDVDADDPLSMAAALLPASMGLSICVSSDALLKVVAKAAIYEELPREEKGAPRRWKRRPMEPETRIVDPGGLSRTPLFGGKGTLEALDRTLPDGSRLITISLSNAAENEGRADITQALFQAGIECWPTKGEILPYPSTSYSLHLLRKNASSGLFMGNNDHLRLVTVLRQGGRSMATFALRLELKLFHVLTCGNLSSIG